jgi:hypothetical protein
MHELGNVIPRLLRKLATLDTRRPIFFTKIDLKDGCWRVRVTENGKWNFAYTLPQLSQDSPEDITLILCLDLAMGWIDSPPFFAASRKQLGMSWKTMTGTKLSNPIHWNTK